MVKRCRRDLRQTVRSEQRHVDRRRRHQQTLIRADVRLGLGATDVLLARLQRQRVAGLAVEIDGAADDARSEEHTSELQSLMRISYAVFCLKKKNNNIDITNTNIMQTTKQ